MKPYFIKTPYLLKKCYAKRVWDIHNEPNSLYLTFDDGPTPGVTDWVMETLSEYGAKATFFCIGKNIEKHPELFQRIAKEGHSIGNHTNNHLNGWDTNTENYFSNLKKAEKHIMCNLSQEVEVNFHQKKLFRPPYGKMTSKQAKEAMDIGYKIIMWDVLSADFDQDLSPEQCSKNVINNAKDGSIIIFHDSIKAEKNMKEALVQTLNFFKNKNFAFRAI